MEPTLTEVEVPLADEKVEPAAAGPSPEKTTRVQYVLLTLGTVAFLYFARPVLLPVFLACFGAMALKPAMHGLSRLRIPTPAAAAILLVAMIAILTVGFVQLGRPAVKWMGDAPAHVAEVKARVQKLFPNALRMTHAVAAVGDLATAPGDKKDGQKKEQTVEIKDQRGSTSILTWTETFLAGLGEVLVLIYLILASGDLFTHKLVRVMPTLKDKKRALDITHEIQQNISNYLFSVTLINVCLGVLVALGLWMMGVPRPAMWGMVAALFNYLPYFGPVVAIILVAAAGLMTFDTLWQSLEPAAWYLALHLIEANLVTPILLGKRFTLNPVAIFISLMFWLWLWGIPGALLSVPILVLVKAVCDRYPSASSISELIGR